MKKNIINGIDVDQLVDTINHIKRQPELGRFNFRAASRWVNGGHSRTSIRHFYGAGQEDTSRDEPLIVESDEPAVLLGTNKGANAVELLLASLTSCLSVGVVYNAAARGIDIDRLEFEVDGDIDLHGFLGLSDSVRPGYQNIRLTCKISAKASDKELRDLLEHAKKTSPVLDSLRKPVNVEVALERMQ